MLPLESTIQRYAWGSHTFLADLQGREPVAGPEAELWLGAHPVAPSCVVLQGRRFGLPEAITADPAGMLGPVGDGGRLPFLLKVLAADQPLSLQAHPTIAQARAGFAREEAAGIPRDAPERSFRDANHKPELVCALTPFSALCGFRPVAEALAVLEALDVAALDPVAAALSTGGAAALPVVVRDLLTARTDVAAELVVAVVAAAPRLRADHPAEAAVLSELAASYPSDPGVVIALLLNPVTLAPGEALFLRPGVLHAYLGGAAVEVMADSDNVLRGGLTPKHVDVRTLLEVLDTSAGHPDVQRPSGPVHSYRCPVPDFALHRYLLGEQVPSLELEVAGPEILLATDGSVVAVVPGTARTRRWTLHPGYGLFVPAATGRYTLAGEGTVFRATVGEVVPAAGEPVRAG